MISAEQIRAARGLLNISLKDLAGQVRVSPAALSKIENKEAKPRKNTIEKIQTILENSGIQFTEGNGVRQKDDLLEVKVFEGETAQILFFDHILRSLSAMPEEERLIMWFGDNDHPLFRKGKILYHYYKKMIKIGAREKIITSKKKSSYYAPASVTEYYEYIPIREKEDDLLEDNLGQVIYPKNFFAIHNFKKISVTENDYMFAYGKEGLSIVSENSVRIRPNRSIFYEELEKWG